LKVPVVDMVLTSEVMMANKPETGPMQFGEDGIGLFLRGDYSTNAALLLLNALSVVQQTGVLDAMVVAKLHGLARTLGCVDVNRTGTEVQFLQDLKHCVISLDDMTSHD